MSQAVRRHILNGVGIALLVGFMIVAVWFEVGIAARMLSDYRASIVRDTVAALKQERVR